MSTVTTHLHSRLKLTDRYPTAGNTESQPIHRHGRRPCLDDPSILWLMAHKYHSNVLLPPRHHTCMQDIRTARAREREREMVQAGVGQFSTRANLPTTSSRKIREKKSSSFVLQFVVFCMRPCEHPHVYPEGEGVTQERWYKDDGEMLLCDSLGPRSCPVVVHRSENLTVCLSHSDDGNLYTKVHT
ncbi:hypothetical protein Pcinc_001402 [Petrolisthes cinctipes]|uniref:Uncharacterized protein n=1 Tax=Petrolisthes cinctipes TaxID=88211 RepID=A0AAE1L3Y1_PETCI|nr:hypothetical protein Pcinc_001402 [Petrolisthes cinctipes]